MQTISGSCVELHPLTGSTAERVRVQEVDVGSVTAKNGRELGLHSYRRRDVLCNEKGLLGE